MPAFLAAVRVDVGLQHCGAERENLRVVHVVTGPQELRVVRQSSAFVADVGDVEHDALTDLVLESQRPVLVARLFQAVCRISHRCGAVGEGRVDERRQRIRSLGKSVIQI